MKKSVYVKKPKADEIEALIIWQAQQKGYAEKLKQIIIQKELQDNKSKYILKQKLYFSIDMLDFSFRGLEEWMNEYFVDDNNRLLSFDSFPENSAVNFVKLMGRRFSYSRYEAKKDGYDYRITFSTVYRSRSIPVFTFMVARKGSEISMEDSKTEGKEMNFTRSGDYSVISFTSTFFALDNLSDGVTDVFPRPEYDDYDYNPEDDKIFFSPKTFFLKYFSHCEELHRLDLCLDVAGKKEDVLPLFDRVDKWSNALGDDANNPEKYFETYYKGRYKKSENRYKLFRLYDKSTDTFIRDKGFLFPHIGRVKNSQRLELEIRQELCKKLPYTVQDILEKKEIQENLFSNYMEDYSSYFEKYPIEYKKFPKNTTVLDYLKPIPYSYLKQYCSFVNRIEKTCSYKGLCQLLLQPKRKDIIVKSTETNQLSEVRENEKNTLDTREGLKGNTYSTLIDIKTVIDPIQFLQIYIQYLREIGIKNHSINKALKSGIIYRTETLKESAEKIFSITPHKKNQKEATAHPREWATNSINHSNPLPSVYTKKIISPLDRGTIGKLSRSKCTV